MLRNLPFTHQRGDAIVSTLNPQSSPLEFILRKANRQARTAYCRLAMLLLAFTLNCSISMAQEKTRRIVLLAGKPSHGYGAHEHLAGCRILAEAIENASNEIECEVYSGGWPEQDEVLDGADAIVMYCDGGKRHPALEHLETLQHHINRGVGFVCIHYAVEVPPEDAGKQFLNWLGGYFEINWSVNPHWVAEYEKLPEHPVTRGVKPFAANDEWYFHMRFQPMMEGVTPILSAVAPDSTMSRKDGAHSGNPHVRKSVAQREPQHTAWVYERADGGRSFGFTGGHYHWNWGREDILRLVSNAIVWTAKADIPEGGLSVIPPTVQKLEKGQDYEQSKSFDPAKIQRDFQISSEQE